MNVRHQQYFWCRKIKQSITLQYGLPPPPKTVRHNVSKQRLNPANFVLGTEKGGFTFATNRQLCQCRCLLLPPTRSWNQSPQNDFHLWRPRKQTMNHYIKIYGQKTFPLQHGPGLLKGNPAAPCNSRLRTYRFCLGFCNTKKRRVACFQTALYLWLCQSRLQIVFIFFWNSGKL